MNLLPLPVLIGNQKVLIAVGIGGIDENNALDDRLSGANGGAVISAIRESAIIQITIQKLSKGK